VVLSSKSDPPAARQGSFREPLQGVRFRIEARIAKGTMTVGEFLELKPGSVLRSQDAPGSKVLLDSGRACLGYAEPIVEDGKLALHQEAAARPRSAVLCSTALRPYLSGLAGAALPHVTFLSPGGPAGTRVRSIGMGS